MATVLKMAGPFGARIEDVDLTGRLDEALVETLVAALYVHRIPSFRIND